MPNGYSSISGEVLLPPAAVPNVAGTPQPAGQRNVTISLRVVLDLSANVTLFAYPGDVAVNPIYCATTMPAADLSGLFAFYETGPSGEGISGEFGVDVAAASGPGSAAQVAADFAAAAGNASAAETNLDASAAVPFSSYAGYTDYSSLGNVALAWAAHTMFSHPDATSPIDNDSIIIATINGSLAGKLAVALLALSGDDRTALVNSVIGQDHSRGGSGVDNNDPAHPQPLMMIPGDVVIVRIQLNDFTAANANGSPNVAPNSYGLEGAAQQFDVVLTLA